MNKKYSRYKDEVESGVFTEWQEVDVEVLSFSELGITVVINEEYLGLVYGTQVYDDYYEGDQLKAFIRQIREDGKIDVSFQPKKDIHVFDTAVKIMTHLEASGGQSRFFDKSSPEDIEYEFQVSKKVFKQAIGKLYKQGKIKIMANGIKQIK